jgi:predicted GTPase
VLTGPQPGITRDSIHVDFQSPLHPMHRFQLVDTAGIRGTTAASRSRYSTVDGMV